MKYESEGSVAMGKIREAQGYEINAAMDPQTIQSQMEIMNGHLESLDEELGFLCKRIDLILKPELDQATEGSPMDQMKSAVENRSELFKQAVRVNDRLVSLIYRISDIRSQVQL